MSESVSHAPRARPDGQEMATTTVAVSVVIPTLNEAPLIGAAVRRLAWADDVIVVDGGSSDDTAERAREAGARVLTVTGRPIGAQRNAGTDAARHRWILALDADEAVSDELRDRIAMLTRLSATPYTAFRVQSRNWHLGREIRHAWGKDWKVRVFTRDHRFTEVRVHENLEVTGEVGTLDGALLHHPYRDLAHHITKATKYARWAAQDMRDRGRTASAFDVALRPPLRFFRDYFLIGAWRDGTAGFLISAVSAFQVFMKYAMLLTDDERPVARGHGPVR